MPPNLHGVGDTERAWRAKDKEEEVVADKAELVDLVKDSEDVNGAVREDGDVRVTDKRAVL